MLRLQVMQENNKNATIQILDETGECRCDVYVELPADDDWRARAVLVVTDNIKARNSDDPTATYPLMAEEPEADMFTQDISVTVATLNDTELGTVLAALRHYQKALSTGGVSKDLRAIAEDAGEALDAEEIDDLCERLNTGG